MKILHIMTSQGQGGAETYSTDVMLSLHKAGIEQIVIIPKKAPRTNILKSAGIKTYESILSIPFRPLKRLVLKKIADLEKPDIIQGWMRRGAGLIPNKFNRSIGWFGGYYDPKYFDRCINFVGVTRDIVAHMVRAGIPSERAHYIPTFPDIVSMPAVNRSEMTTPKDAKVVLALSRLHPKKGLDTLLRAVKELPGFYLWIAGEGPDRKLLVELAHSLQIEDRVRFLGWRFDRSALLKAVDVCALPSRYEPFGTVILEAWAANIPLVAAESAGPKAHITHEQNGLLVAIDDHRNLASALKRATSDDELRQRLITCGQKTYVQSFTQEAVTKQWIDFYQQVMNS